MTCGCDQHKEDICTHTGENRQLHFGAVIPPIYQSTLFTIDPAHAESMPYSYTRGSNPTIEVVEKKIAALERMEDAACLSSGMAAITAAVMHHVQQGDHILAARNIYGPARLFLTSYLSRFGIETTYVDGWRAEDFERECRKNTKLIYLESPGYGVFRILDLRGISSWAKTRGITTMIDNTYATPIYQNPQQCGIDIVIHSASKYLGGHSDIISGVIAGTHATTAAIAAQERQLLGACMDPNQAFLLTRGIRTLPIRMKQHQDNAMQVATFLQQHPKVARVHYPWLKHHLNHDLAFSQMSGCSGLLSFELKNTQTDLNPFLQRLSLFGHGPSWGGFESLAYVFQLSEKDSQEWGLPSCFLRLSIGLENACSLIEELDDALRAISA